MNTYFTQSYTAPHLALRAFQSFIFFVSLSLFCTITTLSAFAAGEIKGKITDKISGDPLAGVNIVIKGTNNGGVTNTKGEYYIRNLVVGDVDHGAGQQSLEGPHRQQGVADTNEINSGVWCLAARLGRCL